MKHILITSRIGISFGAFDGVSLKKDNQELISYFGLYKEDFKEVKTRAYYLVISSIRFIYLKNMDKEKR